MTDLSKQQAFYGQPDVYAQQQVAYPPPVMSDVPLKPDDHGFTREHDGLDREQGHSYYDHDSTPSVITCSDVLNWYAEAWHIYVENWVPYTLLGLYFLVLTLSYFVFTFWTNWVYISPVPGWILMLSGPLYYGWFM